MKIDDRSNFVQMFSNVCSRCSHFNESSVFGKKLVCKAFQNGIPTDIWQGRNPHTKPYPNDNGVQFELHSDAKK